MSTNPRALFYILVFHFIRVCRSEIYGLKFSSTFFFEQFDDIEATFGPQLSDGAVRGLLVESNPLNGCSAVKPPPNIEIDLKKWILIMPRYTPEANCTFEQKVRMAQAAGYKALIVHNVGSEQLIPMYAANKTGILIPSVFVSEDTGLTLRNNYADPDHYIVIISESPFNIKTHLLIPFAVVLGVCFICLIIFMIVKCVRDRRRQRRNRLPAASLNKIPTRKYHQGDRYETCAICLDDFIEDEDLRMLPCNHAYHAKCIDPWLTKSKRVCPICKRKVFADDEFQCSSDSDSDSDDSAPLINSSNRGTQGGTFVEQSVNPFQRALRSISQQSNVTRVTRVLVMASNEHSINGDHTSSSDSDESYTTPQGMTEIYDSMTNSMGQALDDNHASSSHDQDHDHNQHDNDHHDHNHHDKNHHDHNHHDDGTHDYGTYDYC